MFHAYSCTLLHKCVPAEEVDSNEVHLLEYYFFLETYDSNFTTFEKQISYFSLHYISVKILEVESC